MTAPAPFPRPPAKVAVTLIGGPSCGSPMVLPTGPHGAPQPVLPGPLGTYHRGREREVSAADGALRWYFRWQPTPSVARKASYCKCGNGGCPIWTHKEAA